jgi:hypothetical protein
MLISADVQQTQTFVLETTSIYRTMYRPLQQDGTKKFIYPTGRTVYFSRTSTLTPGYVTINWNGNHGSITEDDSLCNVSIAVCGNLIYESGLIRGKLWRSQIFQTNYRFLLFIWRYVRLAAYTHGAFDYP